MLMLRRSQRLCSYFRLNSRTYIRSFSADATKLKVEKDDEIDDDYVFPTGEWTKGVFREDRPNL